MKDKPPPARRIRSRATSMKNKSNYELKELCSFLLAAEKLCKEYSHLNHLEPVKRINQIAESQYNKVDNVLNERQAQAEQERYEAEEAEKFARRALSNPYRNDPDEYRASWGGY